MTNNKVTVANNDDMNERRAVQEAYDELTLDYDERMSTESLPEPVARFCEDLDPTDVLLAAGCGGGDPPLAVAGENAVGLDVSRHQLDEARRNVPARLVHGDMTALPLATNSVDAVSALYSLIHVPLDDHRTVLEEFARVLRSGGTLLVTEGEIEWSGSNPDWLDTGTEMHWSMAGANATREDLAACGFDVRDVWDVPDPATEDGEKPFFLADRS